MNKKCNFIGNFLTGDDIVESLKILKYLYGLKSDTNDEKQFYLRKISVIIIGSIVEGLLHDLIFKAKKFTNEGLPSVRVEVIARIKDGKFDRFHTYIDCAKKYDLLPLTQNSVAIENTIYAELHKLREMRNRIHVQERSLNKGLFKGVPNHEIFVETNEFFAQKLLEKVIEIMKIKYSRPNHTHHVDHFDLPWSAD